MSAPAVRRRGREPARPQRDDTAHTGAYLVALNMALDGYPRDATDRFLAENFQLDDRERVLDVVYENADPRQRP